VIVAALWLSRTHLFGRAIVARCRRDGRELFGRATATVRPSLRAPWRSRRDARSVHRPRARDEPDIVGPVKRPLPPPSDASRGSRATAHRIASRKVCFPSAFTGRAALDDTANTVRSRFNVAIISQPRRKKLAADDRRPCGFTLAERRAAMFDGSRVQQVPRASRWHGRLVASHPPTHTSHAPPAPLNGGVPLLA